MYNNSPEDRAMYSILLESKLLDERDLNNYRMIHSDENENETKNKTC